MLTPQVYAEGWSICAIQKLGMAHISLHGLLVHFPQGRLKAYPNNWYAWLPKAFSDVTRIGTSWTAFDVLTPPQQKTRPHARRNERLRQCTCNLVCCYPSGTVARDQVVRVTHRSLVRCEANAQASLFKRNWRILSSSRREMSSSSIVMPLLYWI